MKLLFVILIIQSLIFNAPIVYAQTANIYVHSNIGSNSTTNLTQILQRLTFVINAVAFSILSILWIWEGLFLFFHKDDREGILKFKHDLPVMIIASIIILGASVIVNVLSYIVHG